MGDTTSGIRRGRRIPLIRGIAALAALALGAGSSAAMASATPAGGQSTTTTSSSGGAGTGGGTGTQSTPSGTPTPAGALAGTGMWIWYVSQSNGGNLQSIIATAKRYRVSTVMIKSGDGAQLWPQFNRSLVSALHAAGLHACAWQYVYGSHPYREARIGATAVHRGADCLLIDAEAEYQGKYIEAQEYLRKLRHLIGLKFPVGLASFPYVDFHPSFPYSVFLGPGGAQFNVPQMYWRDIGTSVKNVFIHTYDFNALYGRVIAPIGEVAGNAPPYQIKHFRWLGEAYRAPGESWWDWQDASPRSWRALAATITPPSGSPRQATPPTLFRGGKGVLGQGDLVVWAQEHLYSFGYRVRIDGIFGSGLQSAVRRFQASQALSATGRIDPPTWAALLRYPPVKVTWTRRGARAASARGLALPVPRSARMRAVGYEIPPHLGAGGR